MGDDIHVSVSFGPCRCGHAPSPPSLRRHPWAALAGFDGCVTLQDPDGLPARAAPAVGDTAVVELRYPFMALTGTPFWASHDLPSADLNGYDDHPGELASFRLIRMHIATPVVPQPAARTATARATILASLDAGDLMALAPGDGKLGEVLDVGHRPTAVVCCGPLRRIETNCEGDLGRWLLVSDDRHGTSLLAHGVWGAHEDEVFAGHRPLSAAERGVIAPILDSARLGAAHQGQRASCRC